MSFLTLGRVGCNSCFLLVCIEQPQLSTGSEWDVHNHDTTVLGSILSLTQSVSQSVYGRRKPVNNRLY